MAGYTRFIKKECLGHGAFGNVYRVVDKENPRLCYALKQVNVEKYLQLFLSKEENKTLIENGKHPIKIMKREVETLQNLDHKNIVKYWKSWFEGTIHEEVLFHLTYEDIEKLVYNSGPRMDNFLNIQMEYCTMDLRKWLNFNPNQEDRNYAYINLIFEQIFSGLHYIHSRGVVHRDMKPENVLLNETTNDKGDIVYQVKIGDFGLARLVSMDSTTVTNYVGTKRYMSPEMAAREPYNESTDIFSTGLVLFECYFVKQDWEYTNFFQDFRKGETRSVLSSLTNTGSEESLLKADKVERLLEVKKDQRLNAMNALDLLRLKEATTEGLKEKVQILALRNEVVPPILDNMVVPAVQAIVQGAEFVRQIVENDDGREFMRAGSQLFTATKTLVQAFTTTLDELKDISDRMDD